LMSSNESICHWNLFCSPEQEVIAVAISVAIIAKSVSFFIEFWF
jgi:hypothetical protein